MFSALEREFAEEAMNSEEMNDEQKADMKENLKKLFKDGQEVRRKLYNNNDVSVNNL